MGLAIVHGIIKGHKGAITVKSRLGQGTIFTILLPLISQKSLKGKTTADNMPLGNETILFVDDEEAISAMTHEMLERLGYTVDIRLDPAEALEIFQSNHSAFDLVITDMTMPKMSGITLSEKIKEIRPDIPIIICSGYNPFADEDDAEKLNISAFVMKPVSMKEIAKTIRQVLNNQPNQ